MHYLPPSLRREKSGAQFFSYVLYGVYMTSSDVETLTKASILLTRATQAIRVGAPEVLVPSPGASFSLSGGGCLARF